MNKIRIGICLSRVEKTEVSGTGGCESFPEGKIGFIYCGLVSREEETKFYIRLYFLNIYIFAGWKNL